MTVEARPVVGPPLADLMPGAHESDTQITVFDERLNVRLLSNLTADQTTSVLGSSGIITKESSLKKSDPILGLPGLRYPEGTPDRGLELGTGNELWQDYPGSYWNYQDLVDIKGNTLTIDLEDYENLDEARIVTRAK